jgi:hypothetical protein
MCKSERYSEAMKKKEKWRKKGKRERELKKVLSEWLNRVKKSSFASPKIRKYCSQFTTYSFSDHSITAVANSP